MADDYDILNRDSFHAWCARRNARNGQFTICTDIDAPIMDSAINFLLLSVSDKRKDITFLIDSEGGDGDYALGLIANIEMAKADGMIIRTLGMGYVGSAAFDIFMAGSKGHRYVHEWCLLMTHASSIDLKNRRERELREKMDEALLERYTGIRKDKREKMLTTGEWFMTPEEAVEAGVADHIIRSRQGFPSL